MQALCEKQTKIAFCTFGSLSLVTVYFHCVEKSGVKMSPILLRMRVMFYFLVNYVDTNHMTI